MRGGNVKLDKALLERVKACAAAAGYSSPEEFITHAVEKELTAIESGQADAGATDQAVLVRLRGLGYIE